MGGAKASRRQPTRTTRKHGLKHTKRSSLQTQALRRFTTTTSSGGNEQQPQQQPSLPFRPRSSTKRYAQYMTLPPISLTLMRISRRFEQPTMIQHARHFSTVDDANGSKNKRSTGSTSSTANTKRWSPPTQLPDPQDLLYRKFAEEDKKTHRYQKQNMSWRRGALSQSFADLEDAASTPPTPESAKRHSEFVNFDKDPNAGRYDHPDDEIVDLHKKIQKQNALLKKMEEQEQMLWTKLKAQQDIYNKNIANINYAKHDLSSPTPPTMSVANPIPPQQLADMHITDLSPNTEEYRKRIQEQAGYQSAAYHQAKLDHDLQHVFHEKPKPSDVNNLNDYSMNGKLLQNHVNAAHLHQHGGVNAEAGHNFTQPPPKKNILLSTQMVQDLKSFITAPITALRRTKRKFDEDRAKKQYDRIANPRLNWFAKLRRISPIIDQLPYHARHTINMAKAVSSPETFELFKAEWKQTKRVLFSKQNLDRTKFELKQRADYLSKEFDKKMAEPYIEPTTEYRLQQKEVLHDNIIDAHYAKDRLIDKIRSKLNIALTTFDKMNEDPRKRDVLMRKMLFTSLDDDSKISNRILKLMFLPFGLLLRSIASVGVFGLFSVEILTSRFLPEIGIVARQLRKHIEGYQLTPNNILQLILLTSLSLALASMGHDLLVYYTEQVLTPRGVYVDAAHMFMHTNSEEMMYDSIRELVINRLIVTPTTYRELYDKTSGPLHVPTWGTAERYAQQQSLIQPIFTQMKRDLIMGYKEGFFLPFERLCDGLRTHTVSLGFTIEALDGFLDAMYLRDTRLDRGEYQDITSSNSPQQKIVNYLLSQDYVVLPPGDVIRSENNVPNDIFNYVVQNFRMLESKEPTMGGELFRSYLELGARLAYRKKLLSEIEMLEDLRQLLCNARFPHITIPQRDIKRIACDVGDPITKSVLHHLQDLRHADTTTPLYPNRAARQYLEASYLVDTRGHHYEPDRTVVNDHYLLLCNVDNPRYTYDTLVNNTPGMNNLTFKNDHQREVFEKHVYHLGMILNKMDAIMVQNYIELRRIDGVTATALNPSETEVLGVKLHPKEQHTLKLPALQDFVLDPVTGERRRTAEFPIHHGLLHLSDSTGPDQQASMLNMAGGELRSSPLTDQIEHDAQHYRTLIEQRKQELRQKYYPGTNYLNANLTNQTAAYPGANLVTTLSNWWYGKQPIQYSEEYEHLIDKQAIRDVMDKIHADPHLHNRWLQDATKDRLVALKEGGYLSSEGFIEAMGGNPHNIMAGRQYSVDVSRGHGELVVPDTNTTFNVLNNVDDNVYYKYNPSVSMYSSSDHILDYDRNIAKQREITEQMDEYAPREAPITPQKALNADPFSKSTSLRNIFNPTPQSQPIPTAVDHHFNTAQYQAMGYDGHSRSGADGQTKL